MSFQHNGFQQNAFQTGTFSGLQPFVPGDWNVPLAEPVRRKARAADFPALSWNAGEVIDLGKWFNPLLQPTRRKPTVYPDAFNLTIPVVADSLAWGFELSLPVRRTRRNPITDFLVNPFHPGADYLWAPMDGLELPPQRPKRTPWQPYLFLDPFPLPNVEPPFTQHVFSELSARIFRYRRRAELDSQVPSDPSPFYAQFDHITWWRPMAEPTRRRPRLQAGAEPQLSFTHLETVNVMRWFMEMQRAVLPKDRRHHQDRYTIAPSQTVPYDWYVAMAEPKRNKRTWDWFKGLEAFPWGGWIEKFGIPWYLAMNEPKRRKPQLGAELQPPENTMYVRGNLPFAQTGPLYINNRGGRSLGFWRGRTKT